MEVRRYKEKEEIIKAARTLWIWERSGGDIGVLRRAVEGAVIGKRKVEGLQRIMLDAVIDVGWQKDS